MGSVGRQQEGAREQGLRQQGHTLGLAGGPLQGRGRWRLSRCQTLDTGVEAHRAAGQEGSGGGVFEVMAANDAHKARFEQQPVRHARGPHGTDGDLNSERWKGHVGWKGWVGHGRTSKDPSDFTCISLVLSVATECEANCPGWGVEYTESERYSSPAIFPG